MPILKRKRRLSKAELKELREIMDKAPQGRKPSIRQLARHFSVNRPSILKSLGGWKGIQRGRPEKAPKSPLLLHPSQPVIQPYSVQLPKELKNEELQG